jgi:Flp pilus assembly protein TadG
MMQNNHRDGQTLIETALALIILLTITLGGIEFARAWYVKNSLKNAVRHGVRLAVVTSGITELTGQACGNSCPAPTPATTSNEIIDAVCCSPGVPNDANTSVDLRFTDDDSSGGLNAGDTVTVTVTYSKSDFFVVGNSPWPWSRGITMITDASMRYE